MFQGAGAHLLGPTTADGDVGIRHPVHCIAHTFCNKGVVPRQLRIFTLQTRAVLLRVCAPGERMSVYEIMSYHEHGGFNRQYSRNGRFDGHLGIYITCTRTGVALEANVLYLLSSTMEVYHILCIFPYCLAVASDLPTATSYECRLAQNQSNLNINQ